ncbi:transcriptional repressor protein KorC [Erwinia amylovora]|nr:transcriptional repressor protein KorC [Erwinia amylovora]
MINKIRPETLRPFSNDWNPPSGDEVKAILKLIESRVSGSYSGIDAAQYIGLPSKQGSGKGSRTFRRWCSEGGIPYSAWALLCYKAGLGIIWENTQNEKAE